MSRISCATAMVVMEADALTALLSCAATLALANHPAEESDQGTSFDDHVRTSSQRVSGVNTSSADWWHVCTAIGVGQASSETEWDRL